MTIGPTWEPVPRSTREPSGLAAPRPTSAPKRQVGSVRQSQPALGMLGLLVVIPVAAVLAIGAGGEGSTVILGPFVTYSLPLVAMVAFWWEDWPGTRLRR